MRARALVVAGQALRTGAVVAVAAGALALAAPTADASCTIPLDGDPLPEDPACGPINPPPPSSSPPTIVGWSSGYDVDPSGGLRGGLMISRVSGTGQRMITRYRYANREFEPHGLNLPDDHPSFSPDARRIVFASNRANASDWDIYVMNVDGSGVRRLTASPGLDTEPQFSPDGTRIAFVTARFGGLDIAAMNADGSGVQRLTTAAQADIEPAWSPDGTRIAFARVQGAGEKDVFVMNADGTGQRRVTFAAGEDHDPSFSPSGERLAITSERSPFSPPFGNVHLVRVSDGADLGDLTGDLDFGAGDPFWSRDGSVIAFFKSALPTLGPQQLFVMPASGAGKYHIPGEGLVNVHPAVGRGVDDDGDGTPNYLESASVGHARVAPRSIAARRMQLLRFSWTHPRRWKRLDTLYLSLDDGHRLLGVIRHTVGGRAFSLYQPARGGYGPARRRGRLRAGALALDLRRTRIVNAGPRRLTLALALRIAAPAGRLQVAVQARDRNGRHQAHRLGHLTLRR